MFILREHSQCKHNLAVALADALQSPPPSGATVSHISEPAGTGAPGVEASSPELSATTRILVASDAGASSGFGALSQQIYGIATVTDEAMASLLVLL